MSKQRVCANAPVLSRRATLAALAASPMAFATPAQTMEVDVLESVASVQNRLNYFAEITETTPPALVLVNGEVELSDEIRKYCGTQGLSFDWLFCGDIRALLVCYRKERQSSQKFVGVLKQLNARQTAGLQMAMEAHLNHGVPLEAALVELRNFV